MSLHNNNLEEKSQPNHTKIEFGYQFPRGGIQFKSEGFSFEQNRELLQLLITKARIILYSCCMILLFIIGAIVSTRGLTLLKELLGPP